MMLVVDYVRIAWWVAYLCIAEPWMMYAAYRFHKHRSNPLIVDRFPVLTLIGVLSYPFWAFSMALGRILPNYPCFVLIWQDFMITYVTFLVYLVRAFIQFFRYEWVHERLEYFRKEKELMEASNKTRLKQLKRSVFFHNHRHWMDKKLLLRTFIALVVGGSIVPLYFSIKSYDVFRTIETDDICDRYGWGTIVSGILFIYVVLFVYFAFRLRKAQDIYLVRKDLKGGIVVVACTFVIYSLSSFTGQFGISPRFPISTLVSGLCCLSISYIGAWRPVNFIFVKVEKEKGFSLRSQSNKNVDSSIGGGGGSKFDPEKRVIDSGRFHQFNQFICDEVRRAAFEGFLLKAFAVENLCFFDSIMEYEEVASALEESADMDAERWKLLVAALAIYKHFIAEDAVLMINISYDSKQPFAKEFDEALKAGNLDDAIAQKQFQWHPCLNEFTVDVLRDIFERPFSEVLVILVDDLFRKFKNTPEYKTCTIGILEGMSSEGAPGSPRSALGKQGSSASVIPTVIRTHSGNETPSPRTSEKFDRFDRRESPSMGLHDVH